MNNTLIRGLQVLEALAHAGGPVALTDLARQLQLEKSHVHRLLQALVAMRYVVRAEDGRRYAASVRLWELGSAVLAGLDLRRYAADAMQKLMEQTGESVHLSVMEQHEVVYVHKVESLNPVRAYSQIGGRVPARCVATGKAILAFEPEGVLRRLATQLTPVTVNTLIEPTRFLAEMAAIRQQGYAVNRGEWRVGVHGVAAPIRDPQGRVVAAIGVSGPAERFQPLQVRQFAEAVMLEADVVAGSLFGDRPPRLW